MLDRLASIGLGSGRHFRAEGEALLARARSAFVLGGVVLLGGAVASLGVLGLLVAAGIAVASAWGVAWAIAIVSAALLVIALLAVALARRALRRHAACDPPEIAAQIRGAEAEIKGKPPAPARATGAPLHDGAAHHSSHTTGTHAGDADNAQDIKQRIAAFVTEHPATAAGGAFALLTLIGPARSLRVLGRGVMLAGLVSRVHEQVRSNGTEPAPSAPPSEGARRA